MHREPMGSLTRLFVGARRLLYRCVPRVIKDAAPSLNRVWIAQTRPRALELGSRVYLAHTAGFFMGFCAVPGKIRSADTTAAIQPALRDFGPCVLHE